MLEKIKNKKCRIGVAFSREGKMSTIVATKYYEGTVVDYDDNFIVFSDGLGKTSE